MERYGIDEVSHWYFEVWNEPNLDFWAGEPRQSTYFTLYDHTARSLKSVDQRLRVGGPATAQAAWVAAFIRHCQEDRVPLDFVSTHVYGDDSAKDVFGSTESIPRGRMVCRAVQKVHAEIQSSPAAGVAADVERVQCDLPDPDGGDRRPLHGALARRDGTPMRRARAGDVLLGLLRRVRGAGRGEDPFYGGYGLLAVGGIPKPAFNAFALLHRLGEQRLLGDATGTLFTRREDGTLVLAMWNYAELGSRPVARRVLLKLRHVDARTASVQALDAEHGNVPPAYERMGAPRYPTPRQVAELRAAAALPPPTERSLDQGTLNLEIAPDGLVLVTITVKPAAAKQPDSR